jgi:hypothetical protein
MTHLYATASILLKSHDNMHLHALLRVFIVQIIDFCRSIHFYVRKNVILHTLFSTYA